MKNTNNLRPGGHKISDEEDFCAICWETALFVIRGSGFLKKKDVTRTEAYRARHLFCPKKHGKQHPF